MQFPILNPHLTHFRTENRRLLNAQRSSQNCTIHLFSVIIITKRRIYKLPNVIAIKQRLCLQGRINKIKQFSCSNIWQLAWWSNHLEAKLPITQHFAVNDQQLGVLLWAPKAGPQMNKHLFSHQLFRAWSIQEQNSCNSRNMVIHWTTITPLKAKTRSFWLTHPNVPSNFDTLWWVHCLGSHFASPKSQICIGSDINEKAKSSKSTDLHKYLS